MLPLSSQVYALGRSLEVTPGEDVKGDVENHSEYLTNFDLYAAACKQKPDTKKEGTWPSKYSLLAGYKLLAPFAKLRILIHQIVSRKQQKKCN